MTKFIYEINKIKMDTHEVIKTYECTINTDGCK